MPSKVVRVSVIDEVVAQLEDAIAAGEYPPNTKLPGEADLAAQLGVSRPILREALARLRDLLAGAVARDATGRAIA